MTASCAATHGVTGQLPLEVLDLYIFSRLSEVREITDDWIEQYNQERPFEALNNLTPVEYLTVNSPEIPTFS